MRGLLVTVLLLITVIAIYNSVAEGDHGMKQQVKGTGEAVGSYIRRMNP
ncbi:hypothetical protein [Paenibacillus protaetiae]|nr:hypothetical protein [Paenibacillus protaetiae]